MPGSTADSLETPHDGTSAPADPLGWRALLVMTALVPVATSNLTFLPGVDFPFTLDVWDVVRSFVLRACLLVALGAWGLRVLGRGGVVRWHRAMWAVIAFLGWSLASSMLSVHVPTAFLGRFRLEGWITYVFYAVAFFLALQYADTPRRMRTLSDVFLLSAALVAGYGLLQFLGVEPLNWGRLDFEANRAFSTFGNPDMLGGFLVLTVPLSLASALGIGSARRRAVYWVSFALQAGALLATFVRGAWLAGAVGVLLVGAAALRRRWRPGVMDAGFAGAGILALLGLVWRSARLSGDVVNVGRRIVTAFDLGAGSIRTRLEIWQAAIAAVRARPLFGSGPETFSLVFLQHKPVEYMRDAGSLAHADNAHDLPLQAAVTIGVPGAILLFGVFVWSLASSMRAAFSRETGVGRWVLTGLWAGIVAYLVHLLFGVSELGSTLYLWLFAGVLVSPAARPVAAKRSRWARWALAPVGLVMAAAFVQSALALAADRTEMQSQLTPDPVVSFDAAKTAVRLNPMNDQYMFGVAYLQQQTFEEALSSVGMAQYQGFDDSLARKDAIDALRETEAAYERVIRFNPRFYDSYLLLAGVQVEAGEVLGKAYLDDALATVRRGLASADPHAPSLRVLAARAYSDLGDEDRALVELERALRWDPGYKEGLTLLDELFAEPDRASRARDFWREMLRLRPGDPDYLSRLDALS